MVRGSILDVDSLTFGDGTNLAEREENLGTLYNGGRTFLIEHGDKRFARTKFHDGLFSAEIRVGTEGLSRHTHRFLVFRSISTKSVLDAVTQLSQDVIWNIGR